MSLSRRHLLSAGACAFAAGIAAPAFAAPRRSAPASAAAPSRGMAGPEVGLIPDLATDQSRAFQAAVDQAAQRRETLRLAAGAYRVSGVLLRNGSSLEGAGSATRLVPSGAGAAALVADGVAGLRLTRLSIDGAGAQPDPRIDPALLVLKRCRHIAIADVELLRSPLNGLSLERVSGRITGCRIAGARLAGLFSLDADGLEIAESTIEDCGDNGLLVWRSQPGEDATIVRANRIRRIGAHSGGSGQNGNGINVFRAGSVLVTGNRISDCAYSAVRANAADDAQMVANSIARIGEVALYAEFAFTGALIASNLVDGAATGIAVTNFDHGGRLAVVQGNLVRNLRRREHEPVDKRGEGITVEADAAVTGNTVEGAPAAGLLIGWGPHMRDVAATGNVIRNAGIGVAITSDPRAGRCLVAQNLISGSRDGAIRRMDHGRPVGPDLAASPPAGGSLSIHGNAAA